ncbi:MAG: PEP-CTERM sorting domain-containing protein [Cyanobacteria bacterium P01_E01_bin.42]
MYEALYSLSPDRVAHIGMSFDPGKKERDITDPTDVPEPSTILGILTILGFGSISLKRQKS